ncbi:MAG TPA: SRPBCC domain-containing protein [Actinomycetota bacterium]|nr:SRPBCC domain-containing protein [Actinomycetota bacterium]
MNVEPIRKRLRVPIEPTDAFRLFTVDMGSWWPYATHSRAEEEQTVAQVVFEEGAGGRIYEIMTDGTEGYWGTVTAWEPPYRVVFDWRPNDRVGQPYTEVDVTFMPGDDGGTVVELEHRGWERLGEQAEEARKEYAADTGWGLVFDQAFARAAGGSDAPARR